MFGESHANVSASTDWDTVIESGIYSVSCSGTGTNAPHTGNSYGVLFVMSKRATANANGDSTAQIYYRDTGEIWARSAFNTTGGNRGTWRKLARESQLDDYLKLDGSSYMGLEKQVQHGDGTNAAINANNWEPGFSYRYFNSTHTELYSFNYRLNNVNYPGIKIAANGANANRRVIAQVSDETGSILSDSEGRSVFHSIIITNFNKSSGLTDFSRKSAADFESLDPIGLLSVLGWGNGQGSGNSQNAVMSVVADNSGGSLASILFRNYNGIQKILVLNANGRFAKKEVGEQNLTGDEFAYKSEIPDISGKFNIPSGNTNQIIQGDGTLISKASLLDGCLKYSGNQGNSPAMTGALWMGDNPIYVNNIRNRSNSTLNGSANTGILTITANSDGDFGTIRLNAYKVEFKYSSNEAVDIIDKWGCLVGKLGNSDNGFVKQTSNGFSKISGTNKEFLMADGSKVNGTDTQYLMADGSLGNRYDGWGLCHHSTNNTSVDETIYRKNPFPRWGPNTTNQSLTIDSRLWKEGEICDVRVQNRNSSSSQIMVYLKAINNSDVTETVTGNRITIPGNAKRIYRLCKTGSTFELGAWWDVNF